MPDPNDVDAVDRGDLLNLTETGGRFDLRDDQRPGPRLGHGPDRIARPVMVVRREGVTRRPGGG